MKPGDRKNCPKCNSVAVNITPLKQHDESIAVFACQTCGFAFKVSGAKFLESADELRDYFRGATQGNQAVMDLLGGKSVPPATQALLTARMLEYGVQMWFDGLKQGLLLGAIQNEKSNGKVQHGQGATAPESTERGSQPNAGNTEAGVQPS